MLLMVAKDNIEKILLFLVTISLDICSVYRFLFISSRFQVSKVVWKLLLKKHAELKHSKMHIYERTSSGKSDGRYMPYPKVDSFLKVPPVLY